MIQNESEILHWLEGNPLTMKFPLQLVDFSKSEYEAEKYTPPTGSEIFVVLRSSTHTYTYTPTQEEDVLYVSDNGEIAAGNYAIIILVVEPSGRKRRSCWKGLMYVHDNYDDDLRYSNEIPSWVEGSVIDWSKALSCFGNGFWDNDAPWDNNEPWNNGI